MRVILPFVLNGQTLEKGKGFPKKVVAGSKDCLVVKVSGIPDGSVATAYFKQSWDSEKVYDLSFVGDECVIDEYITTLPSVVNEYVDYVVSFSVVVFDGDGQRLTTDPFKVVLHKSNYSDTTENTPEIPESQYVQFTQAFVDLKGNFVELEEKVNDIDSAFDINDNPNLLDLSAATEHTTDMWDEPISPYIVTERIPVKPGDIITCQADNVYGDVGPVRELVWMDNIYCYDNAGSVVGSNLSGATSFTVPKKGAFLSVNINYSRRKAEAARVAIVRGEDIVPYTPYGLTRTVKPECLPEGIGGSVEGAVLYTEQTLTEEQKAQARDNIGVDTDVEHLPSVNLWNGEWELGKYNLTTGAKQSSTSHVRNIEPILLDATKEYNITVKAGEYSTTIYLLKYDGDMNFLGKENENYSPTVNAPIHFDGATYVNFYLNNFATNYPGEQPQIMVWESESSDYPTEWQEPGAVSDQYYKNNLLVKREQIVGDMPSSDLLLATNKARFDGQFNYIAYSNMGGVYDQMNTAEHYLWCAKRKFTAIKGDVEVTADGKLVMCHDAGFTFNANGEVVHAMDGENNTPIRSLTEAECLALQHENTGYHICNFETYVRICKKYGKIAFVTVRKAPTGDATYTEELISEMMHTLKKYGMVKQCIVNCFTYATLQAVREVDPDIMLSRVLNFNSALTTTVIDQAVALGNMLINGFHFTNTTSVDAIPDKIDTAVIEYAIEKDIRVYEAQVWSMEIVDKLMEYGITGAQIMFEPTFE